MSRSCLNLNSSIVSRVLVGPPLRVFARPDSRFGLVEAAQAQQVVEADVLAAGQLLDRRAALGKNAA